MLIRRITSAVRKRQGWRLRLLSGEQAERIIDLAISESALYGMYPADELADRVREKYLDLYGFSPFVWWLLWQLVKLFVEWYFLSPQNRDLVQQYRHQS